MLSQQIIDTVKSTAPILREHANAITALFYQKLFSAHPELLNIFNPANQSKGEQQRALADAVIAYAEHIDKLEALGQSVKRIAHKHASVQVSPEHYPIVGKYLLQAIGEHLDLAQEDPVIAAWAQAYNALAAIFIDVEQTIYQENAEKLGGWHGFRAFRIVEIVTEAEQVRSLYLAPCDGKPIATWQAGQYVGVKVELADIEHQQIRQYSLSNAPNNQTYRITVRAEQNPNDPAGLVSNYLHQLQVGDQLELQPPTGDFVDDSNDSAPIFIAGGVGITPLLSMLLNRINQGEDVTKLTFIQCCKEQQHHIKGDELKALATRYGFSYYVAYDQGEGADHQGYLNETVLARWIGAPQARNAYFCGPKPFMTALDKQLQAIGFSDEHRHYEAFGPKLPLA